MQSRCQTSQTNTHRLSRLRLRYTYREENSLILTGINARRHDVSSSGRHSRGGGPGFCLQPRSGSGAGFQLIHPQPHIGHRTVPAHLAVVPFHHQQLAGTFKDVIGCCGIASSSLKAGAVGGSVHLDQSPFAKRSRLGLGGGLKSKALILQ